MKKVLLVWELGAGLGHIASFLPIAKRFKQQGLQPVLILRDITQARNILRDEGIEYIQAPLWTHQRKGARNPQINVTDSLFHFGYLDPDALAVMIEAWLNLFRLLDPEIIFFDYAPTALLASKKLVCKKIIFGNCFSIPPRIAPMPLYLEADKAKNYPLAQEEAGCVSVINQALAQLHILPIEHVYDIWEADHCLMTTEESLDIYPRDNTYPITYLGSMVSEDIGNRHIPWPQNNEPVKTGLVNRGDVNEGVENKEPVKKVFVYLKASYPHLDDLLNVLATLPLQAVVYCVGLPDNKKAQLASPNIAFSQHPCHIQSVVEQCDLAILHGGNLTEQFLAAGIPLLLLPLQVENLMMSEAVVKQQAALSFYGKANPRQLSIKIQQLLQNPSFRTHAQALAGKMKSFTITQQLEKITTIANS